jgi:hypothetical protein
MIEHLSPDEKNRWSGFAVDECPLCHTRLSPDEPAGHWDGDRPGFLYAAECPGCRKKLIGTGKAGGESPEVVTWTELK